MSLGNRPQPPTALRRLPNKLPFRARLIRVGLLALAALVAVGCNGGERMECSDLAGTWLTYPVMGNFQGMRVSQTFHSDGTYEVDLNEAAFYGGHWDFSDGTLTISDDRSCPTGTGPGIYRLDFFDMCRSAVFAIVSDPCEGRKTNLNGAHILRQ
jgi:hypothetical protein